MRVDVAFDVRAALQLDFVRSLDVADDLAADDGVLDVDFCLDHACLADHQRVRAIHDALELGVDPEGPLDIDGALELAPLAEDRVQTTLLDVALHLFPEHQRTSLVGDLIGARSSARSMTFRLTAPLRRPTRWSL